MVLLALFDADYRFLWVDVRSSGSSSGVQIFYRSKLKKKIEVVMQLMKQWLLWVVMQSILSPETWILPIIWIKNWVGSVKDQACLQFSEPQQEARKSQPILTN